MKALAPSIGKNCAEDERLNRQAQLDESTAWMDAALRESTYDALATDWILDCDTTVKLLYGNQDGAEIGYDPTKPGRPSHNIHTYWVANMRLVLDAEVKGGKTQPAKYSLPGLIRLLKALPPKSAPSLCEATAPTWRRWATPGHPFPLRLRIQQLFSLACPPSSARSGLTTSAPCQRTCRANCWIRRSLGTETASWQARILPSGLVRRQISTKQGITHR